MLLWYSCIVLVTQSCPTRDPVDCSPPGSSVHGIFQARMLEWVATPFSRGSSRPRSWTQVSCIGRFVTVWATRETQYSWIHVLVFLTERSWVYVLFYILNYLTDSCHLDVSFPFFFFLRICRVFHMSVFLLYHISSFAFCGFSYSHLNKVNWG